MADPAFIYIVSVLTVGAFLIGLSILSKIPFLILSISSLIFIKQLQNLSISFKLSLSVVSIIMVPGTGQDMVGA